MTRISPGKRSATGTAGGAEGKKIGGKDSLTRTKLPCNQDVFSRPPAKEVYEE